MAGKCYRTFDSVSHWPILLIIDVELAQNGLLSVGAGPMLTCDIFSSFACTTTASPELEVPEVKQGGDAFSAGTGIIKKVPGQENDILIYLFK